MRDKPAPQFSPPPLPTARKLAVAAAFVFMALAIYSNSFTAPFVFDGVKLVEKNPAIRQLWPPWPWLSNGPRPLVFFTFALNYAADGTRVWGYHAANLAIHVAAALVLFGIARRTLERAPLDARYGQSAFGLALAIGLIWLVHPLETQSVTYLVQRYESLMGLFYLLTLYCFIRSLDTDRPILWQAAAVAACACGMVSKEVMVTAPLLVLWYDRVFVAVSWQEIWQRRRHFYAALAVGWGVLGAVMLAYRAYYAATGAISVKGVSPLQYAATQPAAILHYLRLCFWPSGQCLDYNWPVASRVEEIVPPALALGAIVAVTLWLMFRLPRLGFLPGAFFLTLAPTSSIAPIADLAFEHRMYLSLACVVAIVVIGMYELAERLRARSALSTAGCQAFLTTSLVVSVGILGALTYLRNEAYATRVAIWSDTVAKAPNNYRARRTLAVALLLSGRPQNAIEQVDAMVRLRPESNDTAGIVNDIAWIRATSADAALRNGPEAVRLAQRACKLWRAIGSGEPESLDTLAAAYAEAGQFDDAISTAESAHALALAGHKLTLAEEIQERIAIYRAGRPFRETRLADLSRETE